MDGGLALEHAEQRRVRYRAEVGPLRREQQLSQRLRDFQRPLDLLAPAEMAWLGYEGAGGLSGVLGRTQRAFDLV